MSVPASDCLCFRSGARALGLTPSGRKASSAIVVTLGASRSSCRVVNLPVSPVVCPENSGSEKREFRLQEARWESKLFGEDHCERPGAEKIPPPSRGILSLGYHSLYGNRNTSIECIPRDPTRIARNRRWQSFPRKNLRQASFRDYQVAAPLKRRCGVKRCRGSIAFPRLSSRGPIEAGCI